MSSPYKIERANNIGTWLDKCKDAFNPRYIKAASGVLGLAALAAFFVYNTSLTSHILPSQPSSANHVSALNEQPTGKESTQTTAQANQSSTAPATMSTKTLGAKTYTQTLPVNNQVVSSTTKVITTVCDQVAKTLANTVYTTSLTTENTLYQVSLGLLSNNDQENARHNQALSKIQLDYQTSLSNAHCS